jgi:hypothetical protein
VVDFNEVIEKIKDIISHKKIDGKVFDKDVAKELNIPQATFATMKKRKSIPYLEIMNFCAMRRISINWMFFEQPIDMLIEETDRFFQIRYFRDISASAGGGATVFDEGYEMIKIDERIVRGIVSSSSNRTTLEAIHINGESMEPTLKDNSIVFVDRTKVDIKKDGIFVVSTNAGLFIKRVRQRADGMVELISDNKTYSPELLSYDEVNIIGRVVGNVESI